MRRIIILSCSLAFAATLMQAEPVVAPPLTTFEMAITRARESLSAGRISEAGSTLQEACPVSTLAAHPPARAGVCYHFLAVVAMKETRTEDSVDLLRRAADAWRAAGQEHREAWGNTQLILADLYQQRHQPALAEVAINSYLRKVPVTAQDKKPEALSRLALVYGDTGRAELGRTTAMDALTALRPSLCHGLPRRHTPTIPLA